jgi:hypothetical protein
MALVFSACSPAIEAAPSALAETVPANLPDTETTLPADTGAQPASTAVPEEAAPIEAVPVTNCASAEASQLGAAIAADYAFTSTEQVMAWFCDGAEFEDILVALETADITGASAEEMLTMLAAGLTWEEIWQVVGLTD